MYFNNPLHLKSEIRNAADVLVMQGARASAAMVLTWFAQYIPVSALDGLSCRVMQTSNISHTLENNELLIIQM